MKFAILTIAALIGSTQAIRLRVEDDTKPAEADAAPDATKDFPAVGDLDKAKIEAMMESLSPEAKTYIEELIKLIPADKLPADELKEGDVENFLADYVLLNNAYPLNSGCIGAACLDNVLLTNNVVQLL